MSEQTDQIKYAFALLGDQSKLEAMLHVHEVNQGLRREVRVLKARCDRALAMLQALAAGQQPDEQALNLLVEALKRSTDEEQRPAS